MKKKKRGEGGSGRELREFMCKIKRIKPFVIFYLPSGKSLVSHRSLDHLNQLKLCKPFQIYTVPLILLEAMHAKMITWNHFILCIKPSSPSLLKFSEHFTVRTSMWSFCCCCCLNELASLVSLLLSRCPW